MSVTANFSSSAAPWRPPLARTSSKRSPSVANAETATAIVRTGPRIVRAMATASFARIATSARCQLRQAGIWCDRTMLLFVLLGHAPLILLVCLLGLLYLTWLELRGEDLLPKVKLWWGLLVFLTHVPGYLALRIWLAVRRRRRPAGQRSA